MQMDVNIVFTSQKLCRCNNCTTIESVEELLDDFP